MNNKSKILNKGISTPTGILVIVIVALIAAGVMVLWQWRFLKEEIKFSALSHPQQVKSAGWKTYQNSKYNFELKYPENFYVTWEGTWGEEGSASERFVIDLSTYKTAPGMIYPGIRIIIISNFSQDLREFVGGTSEQYNEGLFVLEKIDNMPAYRFPNSLYVAKDGKLYNFNNGIDDKLFDQIISTFKFIK